jgi:hypothetical protein
VPTPDSESQVDEAAIGEKWRPEISNRIQFRFQPLFPIVTHNSTEFKVNFDS